MGFYERVVFNWVLEWTESDVVTEQRALQLAPLEGTVLDLGFGTGINIPLYPDAVTRIVGLDPSPRMTRHARKRVAATGKPVEYCCAPGEQIPFPENTFDNVVSSQTLCSVDDVDAVISESYRVLKPGGTFHFLEHVRAGDERLLRRQRRWARFIRWIGCGCDLLRPTDERLRASAFEITSLEECPPIPGQAVFAYVRGTARKLP